MPGFFLLLLFCFFVDRLSQSFLPRLTCN
jgi:hypothetical protein